MKTVGYILAEFPVLSETFVGNEMRAMQLHGHKVVPIACHQPSAAAQPDDQLLSEQAQYLSQVSWPTVVALLLRHPVGLLRASWLALQQQGIRPRSALWLAAKIAVLAKQQRCAHLHAHFALHSAMGALLAARWLGISVSFVGHGYDIYATPADLPFKLQHVDFTIAVCQQMQLDLQQLASTAEVLLMPCGIPLDKFQFNAPLKDTNKLLFIGRLAEKKGIDQLLLALSYLPASTRPSLDIVGDGPLKAQLEAQIEQLSLQPHVQFLGAQNSDWIRQHANQYRALVAPFRIADNGDRDTGPLVVKEAMALGLPVICSNLMGCSEMIDSNTGYLVAPNQPDELSSAIAHLHRLNDTQRQALVQRARRKVEQLFHLYPLCKVLSQRIEVQR